MKIIRRILYLIALLSVLGCGLVLLCAVRPEITERIADFLYASDKEAVSSGMGDAEEAGFTVSLSDVPVGKQTEAEQINSGQEPDGTDPAYSSLPESGDGTVGGSLPENGNRPDGIGSAAADDSSEYIPSDQSQIVIPEDVAGRNGYEPVQEEREEVAEDTADRLAGQLGIGASGDGLDFDAEFYPYYAMLGEQEQQLYRQIYANANELIASFAPSAEISVGQLRDVFAAVYNDHPELFWMDTAYSCKYRRNGQCVEIDLQFNRMAQDLGNTRAQFQADAGQILAQAGNLGSAYDKERFVHDALIDRVSYDMGAEMNQSAYSALVNGQSVCAGYARAFQYLLQQLGIPCYYSTGYAGEDHAWNIVRLEDGFYNVDVTWDDAGQGRYGYFNKTDQDYGNTHIREELSVQLPPCNGQLYRNLEQDPEQGTGRRSIAETGIGEEEILRSMADYYADCYRQMTVSGRGSYEFRNVIEGEALLQEWYDAYQTEAYRQGFLENAMIAMGASSCEIGLEIEELEQNRYLVVHKVRAR